VGPDEQHHGVVVRRPGREQPAVAIEVATADAFDVGAGKPVPGGVAATVPDFTDDTECRFSATAPERSDLLVGYAGQRDFDRRPVSRFRRAISALRSSASGSVFPA